MNVDSKRRPTKTCTHFEQYFTVFNSNNAYFLKAYWKYWKQIACLCQVSKLQSIQLEISLDDYILMTIVIYAQSEMNGLIRTIFRRTRVQNLIKLPLLKSLKWHYLLRRFFWLEYHVFFFKISKNFEWHLVQAIFISSDDTILCDSVIVKEKRSHHRSNLLLHILSLFLFARFFLLSFIIPHHWIHWVHSLYCS